MTITPNSDPSQYSKGKLSWFESPSQIGFSCGTDRVFPVSSKNEIFTVLGIEKNTEPLEAWALLSETTV